MHRNENPTTRKPRRKNPGISSVRYFIIIPFFTIITLFSCQTNVVKPTVPTFKPNATAEEKKADYERYRFIMNGDVFWSGIQIYQGTNNAVFWVSDLDDVGLVIDKVSPKATPMYKSALMNRSICAITALVSGGFIGWSTGTMLVKRSMTMDSAITLGIGGALFVASLLFGNAATGDFHAAFNDYNQTLKIQLKLDQGPSAGPSTIIYPGSRTENPGHDIGCFFTFNF